jgi:hypothetical protein
MNSPSITRAASGRTGRAPTRDYLTSTDDPAGQPKTPQAREAGGSTSRWQEQVGYTCDPAGNLGNRSKNALERMQSSKSDDERERIPTKAF